MSANLLIDSGKYVLVLGRDLVSARRVPHSRGWPPSTSLEESMLLQALEPGGQAVGIGIMGLARVPGR